MKRDIKIMMILVTILLYYIIIFNKNNNQILQGQNKNNVNNISIYLVSFPERKQTPVKRLEISKEKNEQEKINEESAVYQTIYSEFTNDELKLLYMVVEAEVTGIGYFDEKCNVISVIFNRLCAGWGSIQDILVPEQFACLADGRAYQVEITEETIKACEYVYAYGDTTNGALFFDSTHGNSWASHNCVYIFTDKVGHDFYK